MSKVNEYGQRLLPECLYNLSAEQREALATILTGWSKLAHELEVLAGRASMAKVPEPSNHWKLGMRVMQSELYHLLNCEERAICDELIARNPYMAKLPKDERTDLAQRAVEARGIPDDTALNQSAAALAGDGKSEGTIPKDDTQADIGVDGLLPLPNSAMERTAWIGDATPRRYYTAEQMWEYALANRRASPQPTPSIEPAWLDEQEFYEIMQSYRHTPMEMQKDVVSAFEAVKLFVRSRLATPSIPTAHVAPFKYYKEENLFMIQGNEYVLVPNEAAKDLLRIAPNLCTEVGFRIFKPK